MLFFFLLKKKKKVDEKCDIYTGSLTITRVLIIWWSITTRAISRRRRIVGNSATRDGSVLVTIALWMSILTGITIRRLLLTGWRKAMLNRTTNRYNLPFLVIVMRVLTLVQDDLCSIFTSTTLNIQDKTRISQTINKTITVTESLVMCPFENLINKNAMREREFLTYMVILRSY
jgi:hypothetical protein